MGIAILIGLCSLGGLFIVHQVRLMVRDARRGRAPALEAAPDGVPDEPPIVLGTTDWGSVVIEADAGELVMFVLPQLDPQTIELVKPDRGLGQRIRRMIIVNDPALGGFLWSSTIRERLGIEPGRLHATVPDEPIDRVPSPDPDHRPLRANPVPPREGALALRLIGPNAVCARSRRQPEHVIVVGASITPAQLEANAATTVFGTVAGAITSPEALGLLLRGRVTLFAGVPPGLDERALAVFEACGLAVDLVRPRPAWVPVAAELIATARAGDDAGLRALLDQHDAVVVARALMGLIALDDLPTADKLGAASLAQGSHPEVRHQLATLASLRDDGALAELHLRAAIAHEPPHAPSLINLASVLSARPDEAARAEALVLADRAVELLPDDPIAQCSAVLARAHAGDVAGARARLETRTAAVPREERVILEQVLDAFASGEPPKQVAAFPGHAALAVERGNDLMNEQNWSEAVVAFARAHQLHPLNLGIAADLGVALSKASREDEAIAHYDRVIEHVPGGGLLRLNRGNARRRVGKLDAAIEDYRFVVERAPEYSDARVALAAALLEAKRTPEARAQLQLLIAKGSTAPEIIESLRTAIDSATNA